MTVYIGVNFILNTETITPGKRALCLGEAKMAATTINFIVKACCRECQFGFKNGGQVMVLFVYCIPVKIILPL